MLARLGVPSLIERNGEDRAYSPENWQLGDLQAHHHSTFVAQSVGLQMRVRDEWCLANAG